MKAIFLDLLSGFKKTRPLKKLLFFILAILNLFLLTITLVKVDKQILTPGDVNATVATNVEDKDYWVIRIQTDNEAGDVNTVGVYQHKRISYFQYLLAKISPWIGIYEYDPKTDLTSEEDVIRGTLQKDYSIEDALIVAYREASKKNPAVHIEYTFQGLVVTAVDKTSESGLIPGDIITKIDGRTFENADGFREILAEFTGTQGFKLTVMRKKEEVVLDSKKILTEDGYKLGIEIHEKMKIDASKTKPTFEINKNLNSIGSSGGAMMTLAIYNALTEGDLTKGKVIIGTGTINLDGSVGPIGGVTQKLATAAMHGADIFFVGEGNYQEALSAYQDMKNLFKPDFQLIMAKNFSDIISNLEALS